MFRLKPFAAAVMLALAAPLTVAAGVPGITSEMEEAWNAGQIDWRDIKSGIREATLNSKTVIMVFHAPWCSACKKYRSVFRDPRIVEASKDFVMILIDADADKMANGAFSPDGTYVPRTIFLNSDGDVLSNLTGKDPKYPHTVDIENADELLTLMRKAPGASPPPTAPGENRT